MSIKIKGVNLFLKFSTVKMHYIILYSTLVSKDEQLGICNTGWMYCKFSTLNNFLKNPKNIPSLNTLVVSFKKTHQVWISSTFRKAGK